MVAGHNYIVPSMLGHTVCVTGTSIIGCKQLEDQVVLFPELIDAISGSLVIGWKYTSLVR